MHCVMDGQAADPIDWTLLQPGFEAIFEAVIKEVSLLKSQCFGFKPGLKFRIIV